MRTVLVPQAGGYTGARTDVISLQEWQPYPGSSDTDTLDDLPALRARSRDLERNSPLAAGAINTVVTNVIGTGLEPRPSIDYEYLGLTEEEAAAWEAQAVRIWWAWAGSPRCDIERVLDFAAMQDLEQRAELLSGDVFAVRRFKLRPGDILALKLQIVEADRVCNPFGMMDTPQLTEGIEFSSDGEPVACHIQDSHPGDVFGRFQRGPDRWQRVPMFGPRTGEPLVIHDFHKKRPGQKRGIPYLAVVIESLKQLTRYGEAEITAAVLSAMFTVFVETETGEPEESMGQFVGLLTDEQEAAAAAKGQVGLGPGAIVDLAKGEKATFADPQRPNSNYDPFVISFLRQIGPALEIPFEVLTKHFTSSYSAARAALLDAWKAFKTRRARRVSNFCRPVYGMVIAEAVGRGMLSAPGFFTDPLRRQAWLEARWHGPAPGQIDPLKEAQASKLKIDEGLSTLDEETAAMTGGDWEVNHHQRVREHNARKEAGLLPTANAATDDEDADQRDQLIAAGGVG